MITGGGSGIGEAMCHRFAREGATVVVAARTVDAAMPVVDAIRAAGGRAHPARADVANEAEVVAMFAAIDDEIGNIDILINNAARARFDGVPHSSVDAWDEEIGIVLRSVYLCSREALPEMIARGRGTIVNISSVNGLTALGQEAYSAAKAGVINLTQNLAVRHGPDGVRVNCICHETVRTPIWECISAESPGVLEKLTGWYPLGRVGEPEDIANAALFLASDESAWITGETLNVDGGLMAGSFRMSRDLAGE